jgi:hypothetical protein
MENISKNLKSVLKYSIYIYSWVLNTFYNKWIEADLKTFIQNAFNNNICYIYDGRLHLQWMYSCLIYDECIQRRWTFIDAYDYGISMCMRFVCIILSLWLVFVCTIIPIIWCGLLHYTRWYPACCCENFLNKILRWNVKVVSPKILHGNIHL